MKKNTTKAEYLRPEAEIIVFQPAEVKTETALSAFNVESKMTDWLLG